MKNLVVFFFLTVGSFFVFSCNPDEEVDPCTNTGNPGIEASSRTELLFYDEDGNNLFGGWWGEPIDSIQVVRADGNIPVYNVQDNGLITLYMIKGDWDSDAFDVRKTMDYHITFSSQDTDTLSFEYELITTEWECGVSEGISYSKIIYQDSIYHEYTRGIDSFLEMPGVLILQKK